MGLYGGAAKPIDMDAISAEMQPVTEEWFNAEIEIIDPDINGGSFNRITNTVTGRDPEVLWTGPARIQAMRWPNVANARYEATALRTVVFHLPLTADIDPTIVREGLRIKVTDGGLSQSFEGGLFVVTSSVNSSYAWDRRIETMMDQGVDTTA